MYKQSCQYSIQYYFSFDEFLIHVLCSINSHILLAVKPKYSRADFVCDRNRTF